MLMAQVEIYWEKRSPKVYQNKYVIELKAIIWENEIKMEEI